MPRRYRVGAPTAGGVAIIGTMWVAMTLAMMLPTAGPMILTYAEIAETASRKGDRIVSPHVLIAGYLIGLVRVRRVCDGGAGRDDVAGGLAGRSGHR